MIQEEKELLIKDLCARVPYKVKVQYNNEIYDIDYISALYEEVHLDNPDNYTIGLSEIKPYLRPMSSMTEKEMKVHEQLTKDLHYKPRVSTAIRFMDWLNSKHFDYRGLISMGLALEAPKDMYEL